MKIRVLYFAALRERMNASEATVELDAPQSVAITAQDLLGFTDCVAFAVNDELVGSGHILSDGDTLALIPPMAGG